MTIPPVAAGIVEIDPAPAVGGRSRLLRTSRIGVTADALGPEAGKGGVEFLPIADAKGESGGAKIYVLVFSH